MAIFQPLESLSDEELQQELKRRADLKATAKALEERAAIEKKQAEAASAEVKALSLVKEAQEKLAEALLLAKNYNLFLYVKISGKGFSTSPNDETHDGWISSSARC